MTSTPSCSDDRSPSRRTLLTAAGLVPAAGLLGGLAACTRPPQDDVSAQTVVPPSSGGLLFDAALTSRQDLGAYPYQINTGLSPITGRPRALLMDDPVHGSARTVLRMASDQSADHDGHPSLRVQCETETFIRSARHGHIGDIYYAGFALFLPDEFRDLAETDWLTIGAGAYGSPYGGSGPLSLGLRPTADVGGEHRLVLADRPELLGQVVVPRGRWIDIVMGFRLAYAENGGWLSVWMNLGEGWDSLAVSGEDRASYDALSEGVNDAWHRDESRSPNSSRIGVYGNQPNTLLHGWHRIGHTFSDAMPNSHPGTPLPVRGQ